MAESKARKLIRSSLIALSFFLFSVSNVAATTYYVTKNGSDNNQGTESQPWLTIQKAARVMVAGDSVIIGPGIYEETVYVTSHSGNADKRITFKADSDVVFKGAWTIGSYSTPRHYITIDGFHFIEATVTMRGDYNIIQNCVFEGPTGNLAISKHPTVDPPSSNVTIRGNVFRNFGKVVVVSTGTKTSNILIQNNTWTNIEGDAIRLFGNGHIFRGNVITGLKETGFHADMFQVYDNNGEISTNMLIEGNIFKNSTGALCMVQNRSGKSNISNWIWRNNVIWDVRGAGQISVPYFKFYNNTFVGSGGNTVGPLLFRYDGDSEYSYAHDTTIINNIFVGCGSYPDGDNGGWYHFIDRPLETFTGLRADFNYVTKSEFGNYAQRQGFIDKESHGINGGDPRFISIATGNFELGEGSPAVDSGTVVEGFSVDFRGVARPQGNRWDRGAFERKTVGQSLIPPFPENLRIVLRN